MDANVKTKHKLRISRKTTLLVFLFFAVLTSSVYLYSYYSGEKSSLENAVHVKTETELRTAINNTPPNTPTSIALNKNIKLTRTLTIPTNKNITLTSNKIIGFYKLTGANNTCTITVEGQGMLGLDKIIVTHVKGAIGSGVLVNNGGTCIMYGGEISGNTAIDKGGGVYNKGYFMMSGCAVITKNSAYGYYSAGGGVYNEGTFELLDEARIAKNIAYRGGGVAVQSSGKFKMFDGTITNNTAYFYGGGVYIDKGTFELLNGLISDNVATSSSGGVGHGGGVYIHVVGSFNMLGGVITNNVATRGGGVFNSGCQAAGEMSGRIYISYDYVHISRGTFNMFSGIIANNTAFRGGGVYNRGNFSMSGGEISYNTAIGGGGVCIESGDFWLTNGALEGAGIFNIMGSSKITNNTATTGGGVYNLYGTFNNHGGRILGNNAPDASDIYNNANSNRASNDNDD
ncbi:MAG: hypothetical protein FWD52_02640 [Candidatus Bathyarchaeota archaeon]|nr:hypothetical protein [Candidatus Termiticorpusculum sp.]